MYERTFSGALGPYFAQIKTIGAGGNGRILSGIDTRFDFPVCIKRISVANKDECRAALREIRIRRRLRHENIVGLLNAIVADGTDVSEITPANFRDTSCIYLVQELLDADLRQVIESTRLSEGYVKLFFYQLLRGLKYIHSANVLHRDIKPSNIMINIISLQLMIGDFGHSMVLDPEYTHGNSLTDCATSLWYKAPEIILGSSQYSTASDIWSAGCVLAELLLGRPLFEGENDLEQLEMIIHAITVDQKDQIYVREYLTKEANTMYSGQPKFPLQSTFQKVDFHALHLLERLLSFNANERVTAELALSHPFLQEYSCVADEPVCLKPLHLEHEVDDFLEYTLKDLIVGECVALAEEQPRIHLQMSSYSSLPDITKECNTSPCESSSQSVDDTRNALTVSEDYSELSSESEGNRFKVLEVLKEEHGSSSDSNGVAAHEEGVSEAPLVLDHPMFSSSKWEKERHSSHKSSHRRHHHHRRKSDDSKSRRRKVSREDRVVLKSPCSDLEPTFESNGGVPELHFPGEEIPQHHVPRVNSPGEELLEGLSKRNDIRSPSSESLTINEAQDDKVQELIMRSRQLIADQTEATTGVPAITDVCTTVSSREISELPLETEDDKILCSKVEKKFMSSSVGDLSKTDSLLKFGGLTKLTHHCSAVDLGVAEVIRKSQQLLGGLYAGSAPELKSSVAGDDTVKDLIARSEELLETTEVSEDRKKTMNISGLNEVEINSQGGISSESYNYPPLFTDKCEEGVESEQPPVNHHVNQLLDKVSNPCVPLLTLSRPQTSHQIPFNQCLATHTYLRKSDRRMQELLEESHTLLDSLKTEQSSVPGLGFHLQDEKNPIEESSQKTTNLDQSLDGIDLKEMKLVLDQAKKFNEDCVESDNASQRKESNTANDMEANSKDSTKQSMGMEIDDEFEETKCVGATKEKRNEMKEHRMEEDESQNACVQNDLKHLPCFQNDLHLIRAETVAGQQAAVFEITKVKLAPPLEKESVRSSMYNTKSSEDLKIGHDTSSPRTFERHSDFRSLETRKEVLVKKRSNDGLCNPVDDINNHKHFKNHQMTSKDVTSSTGDLFNGLALEQNNVITNCVAVPKIENDFQPEKFTTKYETLDGTLRNGDVYNGRIIEDVSSVVVVDKLYGNTCRMENNSKRLNSKDNAGLQNYYAHLKIKNIIRDCARANREKRHDTYPF